MPALRRQSQEDEAVQAVYPQLHRKSEAGMGYVRPWLKSSKAHFQSQLQTGEHLEFDINDRQSRVRARTPGNAGTKPQGRTLFPTPRRKDAVFSERVSRSRRQTYSGLRLAGTLIPLSPPP